MCNFFYRAVGWSCGGSFQRRYCHGCRHFLSFSYIRGMFPSSAGKPREVAIEIMPKWYIEQCIKRFINLVSLMVKTCVFVSIFFSMLYILLCYSFYLVWEDLGPLLFPWFPLPKNHNRICQGIHRISPDSLQVWIEPLLTICQPVLLVIFLILYVPYRRW